MVGEELEIELALVYGLRELWEDEVPWVLHETFGIVLEHDELARLRLGT